MEIKELSISDLKIAYDFMKSHINDFEKEYIKEGKLELSKDITKNSAYQDLLEHREKIYHELLNKVLSLK